MIDDLARLLDDPPERPRLILRPAHWALLMGWALATDFEVSGMGLLGARGGDLHVTGLYLLPQAGNAVETELDPAGLASLVVDLVEAGSDPAAMRLWWHSHARETPFWSGLDEHTIERFAPASMVSLVVDHRSRHLARLDRFRPRRTHWVTVHVDAAGTAPPVVASSSGRSTGSADGPAGDVERHVRWLDGDAGLRVGRSH